MAVEISLFQERSMKRDRTGMEHHILPVQDPVSVRIFEKGPDMLVEFSALISDGDEITRSNILSPLNVFTGQTV